MFKFIWLAVGFVLLGNFSRAETPEAYLLQTHTLPSDLNFMPTLGNGHLGYTVFGDAIFMNGVYNGAGGNSKRARIPNWLNISAVVCDRFGCATDDDELSTTNDTLYEMDLRDGYFRYRKDYKKLGITLEQRSYPHKYFNRALVYEVVASRHATTARSNAPQFLKLSQHPGIASDAFEFVVLNNGSNAKGDYRVIRGRTQVLEFERFQPQPHEIYILFSQSLEEPLQIEWPTWQMEITHRIIICIDREQSVALKDLQDALELNFQDLHQKHIKRWHDFWDNDFSIRIAGNSLELWQIANAGIFYLASSLPSLTTNQKNEPFDGLSPTGLGRGNLEADYQGHSFWDTEIWMLPVVTQFGYDYAKEVLEYRSRKLEAAKYNAYAKGYKGARYPWESAYTGTEVTNPCCPEVAQQEIHISADISFALQKFFAQSADFDWTCDKAWPIAAEVAEFLVSRAACEELKQVCHFLNVMGPDEDHANVDDNVYTNAMAKIALEFAVWAGGMCGNASTELFEKWQQVSNRLLILRDVDLDYHPQHEGYKLNTEVKQADTILLGYPLRFDKSSTHLNDLKYYANATRESGPAMTWSMFAANYLRTSEDWRADEYFERGYKSYVRPEFKVWSETPIGYEGSANFLTGIGGFLQALIFGYGGLDFYRSGNQTTMENSGVLMPPNVEEVEINYIRYGDSKCRWIYKSHSSFMDCGYRKSGKKFEMLQGNKRTLLATNFNVTHRKGDPPIYINLMN
ncbi:protein-glucosylgalactosylhydroxylysine glucosidase [Drosophila willistoni]|uniref:protein-glucosylgalactosylhydroxylysine glucosidase n=1 Tax=Drosophila willistoni TaxID=7260 RepID=UPI000C26C81A|nr:protein-glucosylgalactosylhydroxylysine glucosidase [Drosophila willistoni]